MSDFSVAQYNAVISKIENSMERIVPGFNAQVQRIENDFGWIPLVGPGIKEALDEAVKLFDEAVRKVEEFLQWTEIPVRMWGLGDSWNSIAARAGESASQLALLKQYQNEWAGIAGGKYQAAVANQEPAVDQIQSRANQVSGACTGTAISGFGFYLSVAVAIAGLAIAIATAETGVGLVAGLITFILGLAGALATLLLGVEGQARAFRQANEPSDSFPGGQWPRSTR